MRILFVTDSLGAPRPAVPWEFTYPALLQARFGGRSEIAFCFETKRGSTTTCLNAPELLVSYLPNLAVVHLGIVDCVPRIFTQLENSVLIRLPGWLRTKLIWLGTHLRKRSEKRAYVKPEVCRKNWLTFLETTKNMNCNVIVIPVALPGRVFSASSPEAEKAIRRYNELVNDLAKGFSHVCVLPNWDQKKKAYDDLFLTDDGYHLSKSGHLHIADILYPLLERQIKNQAER